MQDGTQQFLKNVVRCKCSKVNKTSFIKFILILIVKEHFEMGPEAWGDDGGA